MIDFLLNYFLPACGMAVVSVIVIAVISVVAASVVEQIRKKGKK